VQNFRPVCPSEIGGGDSGVGEVEIAPGARARKRTGPSLCPMFGSNESGTLPKAETLDSTPSDAAATAREPTPFFSRTETSDAALGKMRETRQSKKYNRA